MFQSASKPLTATLTFLVLLAVALGSRQDERRNDPRQDDVIRRQRREAPTLASLETVVADLSQTVTRLQADLTGTNDELQAKLIHESQKRHELEDLVNTLKNNQATRPQVSFFAKFLPDVKNNPALQAMNKLVVNSMVNNDGQAYDSISGVFTAPVNATYAFFLHDAADPSGNHAKTMQLDVVEGQNQVLCSARAIQEYGGSCQVVVKLQAGQTVWVRNLWDNASYWGGLTTFSGFLLHL